MKLTTLNGSPATAGPSLPFGNVSSAGSRALKSSLSTNGHAAPSDRRLATQLRQDQARRAQAAAQAAAHRRAVVAVALVLLGMVGGSVALVREVGIQAQEVRRG
jgi:hypothetical protein